MLLFEGIEISRWTFQNLSWTIKMFDIPRNYIHQLFLDTTRINLPQERFGSIYLIRFIDLRMNYEEQDTFILNWDALFSIYLSLSLSLFRRSVSVVISYITNAIRMEREYIINASK